LTRRVPLSNAQSRDSHCADADNSGLMTTTPFMRTYYETSDERPEGGLPI
jgi:hypothetical protein